jgi:hypothetical protein
MCGMIAARNHFRREPLSLNRRGRLRQWPHTTPRAGTFARAGKSIFAERLGRRLANDAQAGAWGDCGVVSAAVVRFKNANEKARGGFLRAGF